MPIAPSTAAVRAVTPVALRLDKPAPSTTAFVHGARGGAITGNVVLHATGAEHFTRKQIDRVVYEDISVEVGSSMPTALFDWISTSWGAKPTARDGALLRCDSTFTVRSERSFTGAFISETAFPALDAASKSPGRLTVRITPAAIRPDTAPGTKLQSTVGKGLSKLWMLPNFKLAIDGLDCTKVARIEPFAVRRPIERVQSGGGGIPKLQPGRIDFPNLRISLSASSAESWWDWHESFVVGGSNADSDQKAGSISLLAPNLSTELARIELGGLGIIRVSLDPPPDAPSPIPRVTADLYCELMTLNPGSTP